MPRRELVWLSHAGLIPSIGEIVMKGFRTVLAGAALVVAPPLVEYFGGVDWVSLGVSPAAGAAIGLLIIGLRAATDSPMFKSK